ncbi:hypothetical protein F4604DRAFT_1927078 [Suillus subluteus]|nr:hypothetical protein F4604DRAFT_1927078 [Suillus subluteus]
MPKKTSDLTHSLSILRLRLIRAPSNPADDLRNGLAEKDAHLVDVEKSDKDKPVIQPPNSANYPGRRLLVEWLVFMQTDSPFVGIFADVYMTSNDIDNLPPANSSLVLHDLDPPVNVSEP